ncbi:hypothetical protein BD324DRAFT_647842 [Kockovaella imperatae]|uniref:Tetrahydrofolate dehydrogenase/cyclohydrolase n=1 Tax=Kockovaella imperatae TaxID=4999 RepID=A0A1Y1USG5_9TREE|nr:hypothetical protein BD324DRAFT_647842 [Kockovaella imperatae]ORX40939.1 hypothetical protein BD324DRAFT_647842 [Kockovaella imperatae]
MASEARVVDSTPCSPTIEHCLADLHLYRMGGGVNALVTESIDPLDARPHSPIISRSSISMPIDYQPVNTNSGIRRATAPTKIDFSGVSQGFTPESPPLSSPMIRESRVSIPHFPFAPSPGVFPARASFSRSSSSSSSTLVGSPERKHGVLLGTSPSRPPITIELDPCSPLSFPFPRRPSLSGTPFDYSHGPLFPTRPMMGRRKSSYRSVMTDLASLEFEDEGKEGQTFSPKELADRLQSHVVAKAGERDQRIRIVGILASDDSGCKTYASALSKSSCKLGFDFEIRNVDVSSEAEANRLVKVKEAIEEVNGDKSVNGLFLFLPLFTAEEDKQLRDAIAPRLDIEGISSASLAVSGTRPCTLALDGSDVTYPCTPLAVAHILKALGAFESAPVGSRLQGKVVTVINRSETVGKPLACLLANEGAQVYSIDINGTHMLVPKIKLPALTPANSTEPIVDAQKGDPQIDVSPFFTTHSAPSLPMDTCLLLSDIVISAVPSSTFKIPTTSLQFGSTCINLSEHNNFSDNVKTRAKWFVPRVGSITRLMVLCNALESAA